MERITTALNVASAVIILIAGFYVCDICSSIVTMTTRVMIWSATVILMAVQLECASGFLRKQWGR